MDRIGYIQANIYASTKNQLKKSKVINMNGGGVYEKLWRDKRNVEMF